MAALASVNMFTPYDPKEDKAKGRKMEASPLIGAFSSLRALFQTSLPRARDIRLSVIANVASQESGHKSHAGGSAYIY